MIVAALLAAALIHTTGPSPLAQLNAAERSASFHVLALPASTQLLRAQVSNDGAAVRIEYSVEGAVVLVEERVPVAPIDTPMPETQEQQFNLDGYAATYRELPGYRGVHALTWYRPAATVTVSSRDGVNLPMLVDIALELR